jgi:hypothetical protein
VESNQINEGRNGKCRDSEGKKKKRRTNKMSAERNQKRRSDKQTIPEKLVDALFK